MNHTIGRGTRIVGKVRGDGDLVVEGRLEGDLSLSGHLHVAGNGFVSAPVDVGDLTVEGELDGDVAVRGALVLRQGGTLRGGIRCGRVALEEGARYSGHIEMDVELPAELQAAKTEARPRR